MKEEILRRVIEIIRMAKDYNEYVLRVLNYELEVLETIDDLNDEKKNLKKREAIDD